MQHLSVNNLLCTSNSGLCTQSAIHIAVQTGREALAAWVRRQMTLGDRGWSTHEVARRAKAGGHTLSNGTVQSVLSESKKGIVSEPTLRALACAFGVDESEVFAIYYGTATPMRVVEVSREDIENREKRTELAKLIFADLSDDCQLDTLASMVGIHARRGKSFKIFQRSGARSEAFLKITQLISELMSPNAGKTADQADTDTQRREEAA